MEELTPGRFELFNLAACRGRLFFVCNRGRLKLSCAVRLLFRVPAAGQFTKIVRLTRQK
jgi:hypothetical protein